MAWKRFKACMSHQYIKLYHFCYQKLAPLWTRALPYGHPFRWIGVGLVSSAVLAGCQNQTAPPTAINSTSNSSNSHAANSTLPVAEKKHDPSGDKKAASNEVAEITFDDLLLGMEKDMAFRPFMLTERAQELDGHCVRISGYMNEGLSQFRGIKEFILLRNRECKFGPGGQADHLVRIFLQDKLTTSYTDEIVIVEGILEIKPYQGPDGFTWSVYELAGQAIKRRR